MKVTYVDNSDQQYRDSADEVTGKQVPNGLGGGRLFIGDRDAATYLQLKWRGVTHVVNCEKDCHGLSKEKEMLYLNMDPEEDGREGLDRAYNFIDKALSSKSTVLVHCQTGNGRSCGVLLYFMMRNGQLSLAASHRALLKLRVKMQMRSGLVNLLVEEEKRLRPGKAQTVGLDERRQVVYLDGLLEEDSNNKAPAKALKNQKKSGGGGGAFWAVAALVVFLAVLYLGLDTFIKTTTTKGGSSNSRTRADSAKRRSRK